MTLPLPAGCVASTCHFGADNSSAASLDSDGNVLCAAPPAIQAGVAVTMLEGEALGSASLFGVSQLDGDIVRLTRTGAAILGTGAISHANVGTLAVPPPLTNSSIGSAVRLSFELLVGRGTGGQGFSISFAPVPRGMHVTERGVASALSISFERCATTSRRAPHHHHTHAPPPRVYSVLLITTRLPPPLAATKRAPLAGLSPPHPRATASKIASLSTGKRIACSRYDSTASISAAAATTAGTAPPGWTVLLRRDVVRDGALGNRAGVCDSESDGPVSLHIFRTHQFVPVRVEIADERLSLLHDGRLHQWAACARVGSVRRGGAVVGNLRGAHLARALRRAQRAGRAHRAGRDGARRARARRGVGSNRPVRRRGGGVHVLRPAGALPRRARPGAPRGRHVGHGCTARAFTAARCRTAASAARPSPPTRVATLARRRSLALRRRAPLGPRRWRSRSTASTLSTPCRRRPMAPWRRSTSHTPPRARAGCASCRTAPPRPAARWSWCTAPASTAATTTCATLAPLASYRRTTTRAAPPGAPRRRSRWPATTARRRCRSRSR